MGDLYIDQQVTYLAISLGCFACLIGFALFSSAIAYVSHALFKVPRRSEFRNKLWLAYCKSPFALVVVPIDLASM
jgi:hypothetical protein